MKFELVLMLGLASPALGQEFSQSYRDCIKVATSQPSITICAGEEAKRAEAEMEQKYATVMSLAAASKRPQAVENLRAAQRAWMNYKNAFIEAKFPGKEEDKQKLYGTMFSTGVSLVRISLARQHSAAMDQLIEEYTPK